VVTGDSLPPGYFDEMYAGNEDPWDFTGRWYEERKRALTMASLPRPRFRRAFEPGCSIGRLSQELARRCDELLSTDVSRVALEAARHRLRSHEGARVEQRQLPQDWPDGQFDLIVISEIAYYLSESGAASLGRQAAASLTDDGVLLLCHWLHPVEDYPLTGALAQRIVRESSGLSVQATHLETDFLLEVLVPSGTPSVAALEGLVDDAG
jgi:SAM-dependent methyltransferase